MPALREDELLTPTLLRRFEHEGSFEGADGRHYALILRDDGVSLMTHHPGSPSLSPEQMVWAGNVLRFLNRELHHNGAWVVVFTHVIVPDLPSIFHPKHCEYARYALIWVDEDADPQFTVEWEKGSGDELLTFAHVILAGVESTAQKAESAWSIWHHSMRVVLEPKKSQMHRRARGERAPSAH